MGIDVVYITGPDIANSEGDMPLRWSLRSLDMFASGIGRVIVCGCCPSWLSCRVLKIPIDPASEHGGKSWNILYAYKTAVEEVGIDKPFLYSSDDHYLLRPVDLRKWPRYFNKGKWDGELLSYVQYIQKYNKLPIPYQLTLFKTHDVLAKHGLSVRRACVHLNTWADPRDVLSAVRFAERYANLTADGFEPTCLINAMFERRMVGEVVFPPYTPYFDDWKVVTREDCELKFHAGAPAFSTSVRAERDPLVAEWMNLFFSRPSRWEV